MPDIPFPSAAYACPKCGKGTGLVLGITGPKEVIIDRGERKITHRIPKSYIYDCPACGRITTPVDEGCWLPVIRGGSHRLKKL